MKQPQTQKPYRILMIAPTMFFADYGGHIRILEEGKVLRELGHQITILTYPNGRDIAGLDIRRCWGVPFNYRIEVGSSRHKYYLDLMLGLKALWHVIRERPEIIHAHMHEGALIGWILSKLTGAPLVFDFQGSLTAEMLDHNFIKRKGLLFRAFKWLEKRINHSADIILTSSHHAARLLKVEYGISEGRIHPTPDCVEANTFDPAAFSPTEKAALRQSLGLPAHKKLIVYAGILTHYQGTDHLLKALKLLRQQRHDFHLLLMGYPSVTYYRAVAEALEVQDLVTFTGKVDYETLPARLALGDVATAPKLSATEGCGKILNYMSMALPTVVFKTPVSQEFLGSCGIYAADQTVDGLAAALNRALDYSPSQRLDIGQTLRGWAVERFSWQKTARQIEQVYEAILAGHPQPALAVEKHLTSPLLESQTGFCQTMPKQVSSRG